VTALSVEHSTFVIKRELPASPRHAFRFWSEPDLKKRWTDCHPDWTVLEDRFDFRIGGVEAKRWRTPEGHELTFRAYYLDLVPERRIIYAYEMSFKDERLSASLVTIELLAAGMRTRMQFTEQTALIGGADAYRQRVMGTEAGFDRLLEAISSEVSGHIET
jgi:uncharacterized protein YndB with AHSA1/START domain